MTSKVVMWELRYSPCSPNITLLSVIITQIHHQPSTAAVSEPPRSDLNGRPQHGKRSVRLIKLGEIISSTCLLAEHTNDFHCNTTVTLSITDKFPPTSWRSPKQAVYNIPLYLRTVMHDMQCLQDRVSKQGWTSSLPVACAICFAGNKAFVDNNIPHPLFPTQSCVCSSVDQTAAS